MTPTRSRAAALALALALLAPSSARAAERAIAKSIEVAATLDQAWDAWTTRDGIVSFFAPDAKVEPRVGGAFQIYIDPTAPPGRKGADEMRFLALQPKKMISFDWNAPPHLAQARAQRTFVVVRFEPLTDKTTRVTLHHSGCGVGARPLTRAASARVLARRRDADVRLPAYTAQTGAETRRPRSQGGVRVPTGGICGPSQGARKSPRALAAALAAARSADLVRGQGRRSQSG